MFKLSENYEINRDILKCDIRQSENYEINGVILKCDIRHSSSEINIINTAISQIYINIPREDSVISLLKSYLDLNFDILHAATNNRYVDGNDIRLVNLGPIALFSKYKSTALSGKHLDDISHAHIVSLMFKLITSAEDTNDLSICFDRDRNRRQRELTNNKKRNRKYHVRIFLKDISGFAEHQEKATYGLGYKLTIARNTDNAVLNKDKAINIVKIKTNAIE